MIPIPTSTSFDIHHVTRSMQLYKTPLLQQFQKDQSNINCYHGDTALIYKITWGQDGEFLKIKSKRQIKFIPALRAQT